MKYIDADLLRKEIEFAKSVYSNSKRVVHGEVDLVAELKHHLATTPKEQLEKEWKELEPWGNIGPTVQEFLYGKQPEVDLEKAYKSYIESRKDDLSGNAVTVNMKDLARHFYELGQRAMRKRIMDPEYNLDVIEKMKTEYPVDESNARKEE